MQYPHHQFTFYHHRIFFGKGVSPGFLKKTQKAWEFSAACYGNIALRL
jgi:hypothetical protein